MAAKAQQEAERTFEAEPDAIDLEENIVGEPTNKGKLKPKTQEEYSLGEDEETNYVP